MITSWELLLVLVAVADLIGLWAIACIAIIALTQ
jgi:hypothetical protein